MGSRKTELPPNYADLPRDLQIKCEEEVYYWQLKELHGRCPGDPLLKSREKIK